jgi:hypothetical protein
MSQRNPYADGPSQSQKLYGANLPPSLRWGAARKHVEVQDQGPFLLGNPRARSYTGRPEYAFYRKRQRREVTTGDKKDYAIIRDERPRSSDRAAEDDTESSLKEIPQHQQYTGVLPLGNSDDEQGNKGVQKWLEKTMSGKRDVEEGMVLEVHHENTEASGTRRYHATVEDVDEDGDSHIPVVAGAEDGDQDAPSSSSPQRSKSEEEPRNSREEHINVDHAARASILDQQHRIKHLRTHAPVYAKIHVDYISTETLRYYDIPWEYYRVSSCRNKPMVRLCLGTWTYNDRSARPKLYHPSP